MRLDLQGACTIQQAAELAQTMRSAAETSATDKARLTVSFAGVESADMSFYQLLHSLRKMCESRGVELEMLSDLPAEHAQWAAFCGLESITTASDEETMTLTGPQE